MREYLLPADTNFILEFTHLPGIKEKAEVMPAGFLFNIYQDVDNIFRPAVTNTYPRPMFQPERPAIVLAELMGRRPVGIVEAGIAYGTWMARQRNKGDAAHMSRCFGMDFLIGAEVLQKPLGISGDIAKYASDVLDQVGIQDKGNLRRCIGSADVIRAWRNNGEQASLKDWLMSKDVNQIREAMYVYPRAYDAWPIR